MLHYLELLFGPIRTVATAERLLLGVGKVVMPETCWPPEGFVAHAAHVGSIITVLMLMGLQYKTSFEGFATFLTHIRTCITVLSVPVGAESIRSVGAVGTFFTGVRLVSCKRIFFSFNRTKLLNAKAMPK